MESPIFRSRSTVTVCARPCEKGASQTCKSSLVRLTWSKSFSAVRGSRSYSGSTLMDGGSAVTCRLASFMTTGKPCPSKISMPARPTKLWSPQVDTQLNTKERPRGNVGITTLCVGLKRLATSEEPMMVSVRSSETRPSSASCSSKARTGMLRPSKASSCPGTSSCVPKPGGPAAEEPREGAPSPNSAVLATPTSCMEGCAPDESPQSSVECALRKCSSPKNFRLCDERNCSKACRDSISSRSFSGTFSGRLSCSDLRRGFGDSCMDACFRATSGESSSRSPRTARPLSQIGRSLGVSGGSPAAWLRLSGSSRAATAAGIGAGPEAAAGGALKPGDKAATTGTSSSVPVPRGTSPAQTCCPPFKITTSRTPLSKPSGQLKFQRRKAAGLARLGGQFSVISKGSKPSPAGRKQGVATHMSFSLVVAALCSITRGRAVQPLCVPCSERAAGAIRSTSEAASNASICVRPHCRGCPQFESTRRQILVPAGLGAPMDAETGAAPASATPGRAGLFAVSSDSSTRSSAFCFLRSKRPTLSTISSEKCPSAATPVEGAACQAAEGAAPPLG
mmetsp:Transcript_58368/g.161424  ORF Transcript_58368/g.161424 Transcript_58368/m.161424 type:complete len:565 (+) Transcript_58368:1446-3140(+)